MRVGAPKEIKNHEYRVGLTPAAVRELSARGHDVLVETRAGDAIGLTDDMYVRAGAKILPAAEEVFAGADMIVKVKEPQPVEIARLKPGQTLFTYLHLAPIRNKPRDCSNPAPLRSPTRPSPMRAAACRCSRR